MILNDYFDPVGLEKPENHHLSEKALFCRNISIHTPNTPIPGIGPYRLALLGVPEDRQALKKGSHEAPDRVRNKLYQLYRVHPKLKIIDLGNLRIARTVKDTYFALRDITAFLLENGVIPVTIGGSQDLTYGQFLAFRGRKPGVRLATLDARLDMGNLDEQVKPGSYLVPILAAGRDSLFHYANLGHQNYLVDPSDVDYLQERHFEVIRLGIIRKSTGLIEPVLRDTHLLSLDISSVKQSDAPGSDSPSPNGFSSEEICQIARYAGLSDQLSAFGIFNINPTLDLNEQTAHLAAQVIWHFLEGFSGRQPENPAENKQDFKKFIVRLNDMDTDIHFFKSIRTGRWWTSVPAGENKGSSLFLASSYEEYRKACNQELPDRWLNFFKKLN